jgi:hypothetical protein
VSSIAKATLLIFLLLVIGACGKSDQKESGASQAQTTKDEAALRNMMTEMISFIEVGDYEGLFKKYTSPEDWHRMDSTESILRARRRMMMFKEPMLKALRKALTIKPVFTNNNTKATYVVGEDMPDLIFTKIDGKWYSSSQN